MVDITIRDIFQICAYSTPPLAIAWGPYLSPPMALWNLWLNWRGLAIHLGMGSLSACLVILIGILALAGIILLLAYLMYVLVPGNVTLLLDTIQQLY